MEVEELKTNLTKLGIQFKEIPSDCDNTFVTAELTLPEIMNWELAEKLLPGDLFKGIKNPPKPIINYYPDFRKNR